jgi:NAD-dependent SIR2 family protein deacetylase
MGRRLRVFVSSTMKDLANERDAVCRRLVALNFEPVNAEGWLPAGTGSWIRISQEIESSDVFLLILGERYGWIPSEGPKAQLGLSVTHLEYREARDLGLPILPFLKKLVYETDRASDGAQKRDRFREEVAEWATGALVSEFELASDLAESAGHAVVGLLTDDFLGRKIRVRAPVAERAAHFIATRPSGLVRDAPTDLPERLVAAVANRSAVLFAGAGFSMSAGLPSAAAFAEHLAQALGYAMSPGDAAFAAIASDVEAFRSREFLVREVAKLLDPPQGLQPTVAHLEAVGLFDLILTTNWDPLFEVAASAKGIQAAVVASEIDSGLPGRAIVKLHGTLGLPESLLLTDSDVIEMDKSRARLWGAVREAIRERTLLVIGTSLRDPSVIRLLEEARPQSSGYFIVPTYHAATAARLRRWSLECIAADADSFMTRLADAVGKNGHGEHGDQMRDGLSPLAGRVKRRPRRAPRQ